MVYDTNVVAQAIATLMARGRTTAQVRCIELHHAGVVRLAGSSAMRAELNRVLQYDAFGLTERDAREQVEIVYRGARDIRVRRSRDLLKQDPDDNAILDCALESRADYLVTYNLKDYYELIPDGWARGSKSFRFRRLILLTPPEYLRALRTSGLIP